MHSSLPKRKRRNRKALLATILAVVEHSLAQKVVKKERKKGAPNMLRGTCALLSRRRKWQRLGEEVLIIYGIAGFV